MRRTAPIIQRIDWLTVAIVVILMAIGLFNVASATAGADAVDWFDWGSKQGKQFMWVALALILAGLILVIEGEFFIRTAAIYYFVNLLLLVAVLAVGRTIGGAKSWFSFGSIGIQPSEFAKTGTALMLAWLLSRNNERISNRNNLVKAILIVAIPAGLILLQPDAGTVLVFGGMILVFYREGLSGNVLIAVFCALLIAIATILTGASLFEYPAIGSASAVGILWFILAVLGTFIWSMIPQWVLPRKRKRVRRAVVFSFIAGLVMSAALHTGLEEVLKPHQKDRIHVLFGIDVGNPDADYNIRHAKAAVSSGSLDRKGLPPRSDDRLWFRTRARNGLYLLHNRRRVGVCRNRLYTAALYLIDAANSAFSGAPTK